MEDKDGTIENGLVSFTCQFCGAAFGRGDELSLHNKEKHQDEIGNEKS